MVAKKMGGYWACERQEIATSAAMWAPPKKVDGSLSADGRRLPRRFAPRNDDSWDSFSFACLLRIRCGARNDVFRGIFLAAWGEKGPPAVLGANCELSAVVIVGKLVVFFGGIC